MKRIMLVVAAMLGLAGVTLGGEGGQVDGPGASKPLYNRMPTRLVGTIGEHIGWWNGKGDGLVGAGRSVSMLQLVDPELRPSPELRHLEVRRDRPQNVYSDRVAIDWENQVVRYSDRRGQWELSLRDAKSGAPYLPDQELLKSWSFSVERPFPADVLLLLAQFKEKARVLTFVVPRDEPELWRVSWALVPYHAIDEERLHQAGFGYFEEDDRRVLFLPRVEGGDQAWELYLPGEIDERNLRIHVFPLPLPRPEPSENAAE